MNNSALTGIGPVTVAQGIYSESSTKLHRLGEKTSTNDGRIFRYCKVGGTTLVPGKLYQAPAEDTTNFQNLTVTAPAAGDTSIVTTTTVTLTANQVAEGFLCITAATTNAGQMFRIGSHLAATTAVVTFNLDDSVTYAPTGTVTVDVHPNPYSGVIVDPTTATSSPVGVALYKVTNAYFGWLQTHGPCAVLAQGALAVGEMVCAANSTNAGSVAAVSGVLPNVGYALTGVASTEYGLVFLTID